MTTLDHSDVAVWQDLFTTIIEDADSNILLLDDEFRVINLNPGFYWVFYETYGIELRKGKSILSSMEVINPALTHEWKERCMAAMSGTPIKVEDVFELEGKTFYWEMHFKSVTRPDGEQIISVFTRDSTVRKAYQNRILQQNEELTKINAELDRFVYSASHDLRAPLMSVKGLINMIRIDPEKKNTDHYIQLIERSINKLDHFVTDIIHYSRNSRQELERDEIDFDALLTEAIESLNYMDGAADVRSIRNITQASPFFSDHSRLLMVFHNIIANAVQYRDRWKEDSFLEIGIETHETAAVIRFRDNGIGIAEEYICNIFKMFFRANADSKGSGLGLYIVKGAVDKLGGSVDVQTKLGEGTTFTIIIPNMKKG